MVPPQEPFDTTCAAASGADRCRRQAARIPAGSTALCLPMTAARASADAHPPCACNSAKNALTPIAATRLVHVTHPFHPLSGRQLLCVGERYNRYGTTLLLETGEGTVCAVRPHWTDVVARDPEIILGGQKALFRVADLLELAHLVDRLSGRDRSER